MTKSHSQSERGHWELREQFIPEGTHRVKAKNEKGADRDLLFNKDNKTVGPTKSRPIRQSTTPSSVASIPPEMVAEQQRKEAERQQRVDEWSDVISTVLEPFVDFAADKTVKGLHALWNKAKRHFQDERQKNQAHDDGKSVPTSMVVQPSARRTVSAAAQSTPQRDGDDRRVCLTDEQYQQVRQMEAYLHGVRENAIIVDSEHSDITESVESEIKGRQRQAEITDGTAGPPAMQIIPALKRIPHQD
jgi:hypothetical protein